MYNKKRPPVIVVVPNTNINRCPRKIPQHLGGCYCMTYICCGILSPDPHTNDCGGVIEMYERADGSISETKEEA